MPEATASVPATEPRDLGRSPLAGRRILVVLHLADSGGPHQHMRPWLEAVAREASLEVVVPADGRVRRLYEPLGATTVLAYEPLVFPCGLLHAARLAASFVREVRTFRGHIRATRPDVVVVVTTVLPAGLVAARMSRTPAVVYALELFDKRYVRSALRTGAGRALATLTGTLATAIVCCSHAVADQFGGRVRRRNALTTIYAGLDADRFRGDRRAARRVYGVSAADPCLAVIGNIARGRGQDLVIRALPLLRERFPDVHCLVAGVALERPLDLEFRGQLGRLARELGVADAVTFTGFVDPVADVYAAADIVINPARFNEPFGRVAIEALAAGRPVVATRVGAIPEVLRDGEDALLVEPDDPYAIASAVTSLWADEDLRRQLVAAGRTRVANEFRERDSVDRFVGVLGRILAHRPKR